MQAHQELAGRSARVWPAEITVDWRRLEIGLWRTPAGDISAAYSADKLPRVKTFTHEGQRFTNLGGAAAYANCYPLLPPETEVVAVPYSYAGRRVTHARRSWRIGSCVEFRAADRSVAEWSERLRITYADGGHFAAGKPYAQMLREFRRREHWPPNARIALERELLRPALPLTPAAMREFLAGKKLPAPPPSASQTKLPPAPAASATQMTLGL